MLNLFLTPSSLYPPPTPVLVTGMIKAGQGRGLCLQVLRHSPPSAIGMNSQLSLSHFILCYTPYRADCRSWPGLWQIPLIYVHKVRLCRQNERIILLTIYYKHNCGQFKRDHCCEEDITLYLILFL